MKKKLLWIGDAGVPSGFARATHKTLEQFLETFDVTVLGLNYRGDPHPYPYPIFSAGAGGDAFGVGRTIWTCDVVKPDVIIIQNDPWNIPLYTSVIRRIPEYAGVPIIGSIAVDGLNCMGAKMHQLNGGVFWTQFGLDQAREGGYVKDGVVIPLGVDREIYRPLDQLGSRAERFGPGHNLDKAFIVGNVNRNQLRKRLDLTIRYFAKWIKKQKIGDAWLYIHVCPTGDDGIEVRELARYYGVLDRLIMNTVQTWYGLPEEQMAFTYNCFDAQVNTGVGEGMGLTTLEGMACGVPQIVGDYAALGDWAKGAAYMVPCTSTAIMGGQNVIGGVPDETAFINALQFHYANPHVCVQNGQAGLERAGESRFDWKSIGQAFCKYVERFTQKAAA